MRKIIPVPSLALCCGTELCDSVWVSLKYFLFCFVLLLHTELNDNFIRRENCDYLEKQIFLVEEYQ